MANPDVTNRFGSRFHISKLDHSSFDAAGRRSFFAYRDLGLADATSGQFAATVTRVVGELEESTTEWHYHVCDFQAIYIVRGSIDVAFEETGVLHLGAGTFINIPPGLLHNEIRVSTDMEILSLTIPAKIGTVTVPAPAGSVLPSEPSVPK